MRGLAIRWFLNALALLCTALFIPGIEVNGIIAALLSALVLGVVNAIIRPLVLLFTLPLNILSLGVFTFVINALMLMITATAVRGFVVSGFWAAFFGAILLTVISGVLSSVVLDHSGRRRRF